MKRPPSGQSVDAATFAKMRRIVPTQLAARRSQSEWSARPLPEEVAFKLTNRCDLRCTHCYQWKEGGYHHQLVRSKRQDDLPLSVIQNVLEQTHALRSNVFLWGGEPLVYRQWDDLIDLLAGDPRWTSICTNGTLIGQRLTSLVRLEDRIEVSISIDGFEADHDALRGVGAFAATLNGLRTLVAAKRAGPYRGEISVNCVLSDALIGRIDSLVNMLEAEGAETVYLSFPWFISEGTAAKMDHYFAAHFPERQVPTRGSWRSYDFSISPDRLDALRADLARVAERTGPARLRYNPELSDDELAEFLEGSDRPAQGKTRCLALQTRLDVFPDGEVVSCKFFPELSVGNLQTSSLDEVWHGEAFGKIRETVSRCGLMPVCAKCNLLYTRGA